MKHRFLVWTLLVLCFFLCDIGASPKKSAQSGRAIHPVFVYAATTRGSIVGFRVAPDTGIISPLPEAIGETGTGLTGESLLLTKHPNGRFLYAAPAFNLERDGYPWPDPSDNPQPMPARKTTVIRVYRIARSGALTPVQTLTVPAPIGDLAMYPGGSRIYAPTDLPRKTPDSGNRIFVLRVLADGRLHRESQDAVAHLGFTYANTFYQDNWGLTFSPRGGYAYSYVNSYAADWSSHRYYRYRILRNGAMREERTDWFNMGDYGAQKSVEKDAGRIAGWSTDGKTAFVRSSSSNRVWVCAATEAGRISSHIGFPAFLSFASFTPPGTTYWAAPVATHPARPFVYHGSATGKTPYTAYRIVAPGKLKPIGTFRTAFADGKTVRYLTGDQMGQFLYEIGFDAASETPVRHAVYRIGANGLPMLIVKPTVLPIEVLATLHFVLPSAP